MSILRNGLAVVGGFIVGSVVNGGLISVGSVLVPPPDGVDISTMESLAEGIHLFGPQHFAVPFLAHALGTLTGSWLCYRLASGHREALCWGLGAVFLLGGIAAAFMIPAPTWFIFVDLLLAYLPMAWLGMTLGKLTSAAPDDTG